MNTKLRNMFIALGLPALLWAFILSPLMLIATADPAQAQGITGSGTLPNTNGLRLSLSSSDPVPTSDQSGATVYAIPYTSPYVTLLTSAGSLVQVLKMGTVSVSLGTNYFRRGYLYYYRNSSGKLALEVDWWDSGGQTTATISGASAATECVLTTSAAHGLNVGDYIGVRNITGTVGTDSSRGINNHVFYVKTVGSSTTCTLEGADTQSLSYTSGGTLYKIPTSPTTALAWNAKIGLVKTGDSTRKYAGLVRTAGDGNAKDGNAQRLLSNAENLVWCVQRAQVTADSWSYNGGATATRKLNNEMTFGGTVVENEAATPRIGFITGAQCAAGSWAGTYLFFNYRAGCVNMSGGTPLGTDGDANVFGPIVFTNNTFSTASTQNNTKLLSGGNRFTIYEIGSSATIYGDGGGSSGNADGYFATWYAITLQR